MKILSLVENKPIVEQREMSNCDFKIFHEDDISWQLQNDIHRMLNTTFKGKSLRFIASF